MRCDDPVDTVQLRDGSSYVGEVTTARFTLKTLAADTPITIQKGNVVSIVFRTTGVPFDRVQLKDGSELTGAVMDDRVGFRSGAIGPIDLATKNILAIQLLSSMG